MHDPAVDRGVGVVVAWNDDGRRRDGGELFIRHPHDRQSTARDKQGAQPFHHIDEMLRVHRHQRGFMFRVERDAPLIGIGRADRRHAAILRGADKLVVIEVRQTFGREIPARRANQHQPSRCLRMFDGKQHRCACARTRSADKGGPGVKLAEELMQIVGPGMFLRLMRFQQQVARPGIAPVMQQYPETLRREFFRDRDKLVAWPAPAGGQCHPRSVIADHLIADFQTAHRRKRHGCLP